MIFVKAGGAKKLKVLTTGEEKDTIIFTFAKLPGKGLKMDF